MTNYIDQFIINKEKNDNINLILNEFTHRSRNNVVLTSRENIDEIFERKRTI